jgi:hypothetical protein
VTPDGISARFALDSICKSMAAEIRVVLINSSYFWSFLDCHVHISSITPSFYTGIFAPYLSGKWSGAYLLAERERLKVLGRLLPILYKCDYEFIVYGGRISIIFNQVIFSTNHLCVAEFYRNILKVYTTLLH